MKARRSGVAVAVVAILALLLACTRSVSTAPPHLNPSQIASAPAQLSPSLTPSLVEATAYPAADIPAITSQPPVLVTQANGGESPIVQIPLAGPLSRPEAEISGMAWHAGELILLPQYPERFGDGQTGAVFAISQADILAYLDGTKPGPLEPRPVTFIATGIQEKLPGYQGFEALAIDGDRVFLTVETRPGEMLGYLVSGLMAADNSAIALDLANMTPIPPQASIANFTDEALLVFGNRLVSLYEAYGAAVNPDPVAHLFDKNLQMQDNLPFPNVEYRVTDATSSDENGRFWVINTFYPGDEALQTSNDPLAAEFGEGATHQNSPIVERLVQFQFSEDGVVFAETPPIQLVLSSDGKERNWEAIAPLQGRGFLIATDQYPSTILAFIEHSE
jgi:hypothetical protein